MPSLIAHRTTETMAQRLPGSWYLQLMAFWKSLPQWTWNDPPRNASRTGSSQFHYPVHGLLRSGQLVSRSFDRRANPVTNSHVAKLQYIR